MQQHRPQNSQLAMHYNTTTTPRHSSARSSSRIPRPIPQSTHRPRATAQSQQTQTQTHKAFRPMTGPQNNTTNSRPAYVPFHTPYQLAQLHISTHELPAPLRAGLTPPRQPTQERLQTADSESLVRSISTPKPSNKIENVVQAAEDTQQSEQRGLTPNRGSELFANDPQHLNSGNNQSPTHPRSPSSRNTESHTQRPSTRSSAVANTGRGDRQDSVHRSQRHLPGTSLRTQTQASSRSRHNTFSQTIPVPCMETNAYSDKEVVVSSHGDSVSSSVSANPFEFAHANHLHMMAFQTGLAQADQEAAEFHAYTSLHALDQPGPLYQLNAANPSPISSTSEGSNRSPDAASSMSPVEPGLSGFHVVNTPAIPSFQIEHEVDRTVSKDNGLKGHLPIQYTNHQENNRRHHRDSGVSFALATQALPLMSVSTNIQRGNAFMRQGLEQARDAGARATAQYMLAGRLTAQQAGPMIEEAAVNGARMVEDSTLSAFKDVGKKLTEAGKVVVKGAQKLEHEALVTVGLRDRDTGESFANLQLSSFFPMSSSSPSSSPPSSSSSSSSKSSSS